MRVRDARISRDRAKRGSSAARQSAPDPDAAKGRTPSKGEAMNFLEARGNSRRGIRCRDGAPPGAAAGGDCRPESGPKSGRFAGKRHHRSGSGPVPRPPGAGNPRLHDFPGGGCRFRAAPRGASQSRAPGRVPQSGPGGAFALPAPTRSQPAIRPDPRPGIPEQSPSFPGSSTIPAPRPSGAAT